MIVKLRSDMPATALGNLVVESKIAISTSAMVALADLIDSSDVVSEMMPHEHRDGLLNMRDLIRNHTAITK